MSDYIVISEGSMGVQGATGATGATGLTGSVTAEVQELYDETLAARDTAVTMGNSAVAAASTAVTSSVNASASEVAAANSANAANLAAQNIGSLAYTTVALMNADLAHVVNTIALVTNDATATNNGQWIKLGESGAGSWQKSTYVPPVASNSIIESSISSTFPVLVGVKSKNLFNKAKLTAGSYVSYETGTIVAASGFNYSEYIPVMPNTTYTLSGSSQQFAFYNDSKSYIGGNAGSINTVITFTTPTSCAYIRLTVHDMQVSVTQLELGSTASSYESYEIKIRDTSLPANIVTGIKSKNLFDCTAVILDYYVNFANGDIVASSGYFTSDYIPVTGNTYYTIKSAQLIAFYNSAREFISGIVSVNVLITPANATYLRFSDSYAANLETNQVEEGRIATDFNSYGYVVPINRVESNNNIFIKTTEIIVREGGVIGTNCNFTAIKPALDSITDNGIANRYIIRLINGDYDVSNDGNNFLGLKNYVDIIGQSRNGVRVIKREATESFTKSTFDPYFYGQEINYASLRNMTIISKNTKCPVHIDGLALNGSIEIIDCNLINENQPDSGNYMNGLACGLRHNQHVIIRGCYSNGALWAHNSNESHYLDNGCSFELYNCISRYIQVGDLLSYGKDKFIADGCKAEFFQFVYYQNYGGQLSYVQPSWEFQLMGNNFEYVKAIIFGNQESNCSEDIWNSLYGGKWSISEPNIHAYCKNTTLSTITKGSLVTLDSLSDMEGIKLWSAGNKLYGVVLDTLVAGDFGVVQDSGYVSIIADGTTNHINFNDPLELNSLGVAIKHTSGDIIGYSRATLTTSAVIKVKLCG